MKQDSNDSEWTQDVPLYPAPLISFDFSKILKALQQLLANCEKIEVRILRGKSLSIDEIKAALDDVRDAIPKPASLRVVQLAISDEVVNK
jgi:hypothetical protein